MNSQATPKRLQRKRTTGARLPPGTICCTRGTPWGNPFQIGKPGPLGRVAPDAEGAVGFFKDMLNDPELRKIAGYPESLEPLRGHDLACWCDVDAEYCHVDIILEILGEGVANV